MDWYFDVVLNMTRLSLDLSSRSSLTNSWNLLSEDGGRAMLSAKNFSLSWVQQ